eukprot:1491070-Prorocentrum_lima.AAC.1
MTSSLVGSEMCIRDRSVDAGPRAPESPLSSRPPRRPLHKPRQRYCRPVSYTHLTLPTICSV